MGTRCVDTAVLLPVSGRHDASLIIKTLSAKIHTLFIFDLKQLEAIPSYTLIHSWGWFECGVVWCHLFASPVCLQVRLVTL